MFKRLLARISPQLGLEKRMFFDRLAKGLGTQRISFVRVDLMPSQADGVWFTLLPAHAGSNPVGAGTTFDGTSWETEFRDEGATILMADHEPEALPLLTRAAAFIQKVRPLIIFRYGGKNGNWNTDKAIQDQLGRDYAIFSLNYKGLRCSDYKRSRMCVGVNQFSLFPRSTVETWDESSSVYKKYLRRRK